MFGIDMGFWYGIFSTFGITLILSLVAWLVPPKKNDGIK